MPSVTISGAKTQDNLVTYLDYDVLEAAKRRMHHILDTFDSVVVAFSGGKDSLAVLNLFHEVKLSRGDTSQIDVIFRDEELIPDVVIDFVDHYRQLPWIKMLWFTVPLHNLKFILGRNHPYTQWDPEREWVRPKPPWSIAEVAGFEGRTFDQYTMDTVVAACYPGKICTLTGIRTSESLMRYRSVINKISEPEVAGTKEARLMLGRPIYDWAEDDVFKYFHDNGIKYCGIYDQQVFNGESLRVSSPLHAEAAKRIDVLKTRDPVFLDRILKILPEVGLQVQYYRDFDTNAVIHRYPQTWEGVQMLIDEKLEPEHRAKAMERIKVIKHMAGSVGGYPIDYVMGYLLLGTFIKRMLLPKNQNKS